MQRGITYFANGNRGKAIADLDEVIKLEPNNMDALSRLGLYCRANGEYAKSIIALESICKAKPKDYYVRVELAKIFACCPDEKIRDGKKALEFATEAYEMTKKFDFFWQPQEAMAMSYAELGKFEGSYQVAEERN